MGDVLQHCALPALEGAPRQGPANQGTFLPSEHLLMKSDSHITSSKINMACQGCVSSWAQTACLQAGDGLPSAVRHAQVHAGGAHGLKETKTRSSKTMEL